MTYTGSTGNDLKPYYPHHLSTNIGPPIHVGFPESQTVKSSKPHLLHLTDLSDEAFKANILPRLTHSSLFSIFKLYDFVRTAEFKSKQFTIKFNSLIVTQGTRNRRSGL